MADIIVSSPDLTVLGGPASINVDVDLGSAGVRGTYIFTGDGKPTDPSVAFFGAGGITGPNINDLYMNLKSSDSEFLFLYQYLNQNGSSGWQKLFRLVPSTALFNQDIPFINGEAYTFTPNTSLPSENQVEVGDVDFTSVEISPVAPSSPNPGDLWLDVSAAPYAIKIYNPLIPGGWLTLGTFSAGLPIPISAFLDLEQIGIPDATKFNIQYSILSTYVNSSSIQIGSIVQIGQTVILPVGIKLIEFVSDAPVPGWYPVTGLRMVHGMATYGIGAIPTA